MQNMEGAIFKLHTHILLSSSSQSISHVAKPIAPLPNKSPPPLNYNHPDNFQPLFVLFFFCQYFQPLWNQHPHPVPTQIEKARKQIEKDCCMRLGSAHYICFTVNWALLMLLFVSLCVGNYLASSSAWD